MSAASCEDITAHTPSLHTRSQRSHGCSRHRLTSGCAETPHEWAAPSPRLLDKFRPGPLLWCIPLALKTRLTPYSLTTQPPFRSMWRLSSGSAGSWSRVRSIGSTLVPCSPGVALTRTARLSPTCASTRTARSRSWRATVAVVPEHSPPRCGCVSAARCRRSKSPGSAEGRSSEDDTPWGLRMLLGSRCFTNSATKWPLSPWPSNTP
mmetsp:Transcript_96020/g.248795  ORF Transcript_96020/g.248795 Transcript_96020/m.248795 type:complete len:207 (+) Transcript_96020:508-1128(+)